MSEAVPATAGGLLKAAREKQGIHIAALAAAIKVTPRKLEALEADRYGDLPDMTFVRALAKTVCRSLKIEAEPVLALLPHQADSGTALAQVSTGLNQPFRERPARGDPPDWAVLQKPVLWGAGAVLLAALVVYLLPERALDRLTGAERSAAGNAGEIVGAAATGASGVVNEVIEAASAAIETVHSVPSAAEQGASQLSSAPGTSTTILNTPVPPVPPTTPATTAPAAVPSPAASAAVAAARPAASVPAATSPTTPSPTAPAAGALVLRASAESWVEVRDRAGKVLLSRTLQPGETVGVDGEIPLKATIGNAAGTQVTFRGQPVDTSTTRDNVARLELK